MNIVIQFFAGIGIGFVIAEVIHRVNKYIRKKLMRRRIERENVKIRGNYSELTLRELAEKNNHTVEYSCYSSTTPNGEIDPFLTHKLVIGGEEYGLILIYMDRYEMWIEALKEYGKTKNNIPPNKK